MTWSPLVHSGMKLTLYARQRMTPWGRRSMLSSRSSSTLSSDSPEEASPDVFRSAHRQDSDCTHLPAESPVVPVISRPKVDLCDLLTVFVCTVGYPTFEKCLECLHAQDSLFSLKIIDHVAPI